MRRANTAAIEHFIDQQIDQRKRAVNGYFGDANLSFCFGSDVPHLPCRAARLHNGHDVISRLCDPV
jgi:hypothetical protein